VTAPAPSWQGRISRRTVPLADGLAAWIERGSGDGPPLVLIHGFAGDALTWQFNLHALAAAGRRVLALDLPGHGASTAELGPADMPHLAGWILRALDALGIARAGLVGHSLGARVALAVAEQAPERVAALTLISCAGLGTAVDMQVLYRLLGVRTLPESEAVVARLFGPGSAPAVRDRLARALYQRLSADPAVPALLSTLLDGCQGSLTAPPPDLSRLSPPVQLIWGVEDAVVAPPEPAAMSTLPLHLLPGVGHMPHVEAASRVNDLIGSLHR